MPLLITLLFVFDSSLVHAANRGADDSKTRVCVKAIDANVMSFEDARKIALEQNLFTRSLFKRALEVGELPANFPREPWTYPEWRGYGHFGSEKGKVFRSYAEHKAIVARLDILSESAWSAAYREKRIPGDYAKSPVDEFRELCHGWERFTGNRYQPKSEKPPYEQLSAWALTQPFSDMQEYRRAVRAGRGPKGAPLDPQKNYALQFKPEDFISN